MGERVGEADRQRLRERERFEQTQEITEYKYLKAILQSSVLHNSVLPSQCSAGSLFFISVAMTFQN